MTESPARAVAQFRRAFGLSIAPEPTLISGSDKSVALSLILEETGEVAQAVSDGDLPAIAHELADLVYVAYCAALAYGVDLDRVIDEVHRANMTKLGADGRPILREDGKVLKPPTFEPADVAAVLDTQRTLGRYAEALR